jgi:hypothetical protein
VLQTPRDLKNCDLIWIKGFFMGLILTLPIGAIVGLATYLQAKSRGWHMPAFAAVLLGRGVLAAIFAGQSLSQNGQLRALIGAMLLVGGSIALGAVIGLAGRWVHARKLAWGAGGLMCAALWAYSWIG